MGLFTFHIHNHIDTEKLFAKIDFLIKNSITMSTLADEIKALMNSALGKIDRVEADTKRLLALIAGLPDQPTVAEVQEIKTLAEQLDAKIQAVDDSVPDETAPTTTSGRTMKTGGK